MGFDVRRQVAAIALIGMLATGDGGVRAADPQPYDVAIAETGNEALDTALDDASLLKSLREKASVGPFALISRARADRERLETVLQGFGYYDGKLSITIDARTLDDPELPQALAEIPEAKSVDVKISAETGSLYHLGRITIEGAVPSDAKEKLGLSTGQPAVAAEVLAAQTRLLAALQEEGYALAKVDAPDAIQQPQNHTIDVTFTAMAGQRAVIGPINVTGLDDVNESFVRQRLLVHSGQLYQPSKIDEARQDLAAIGVFSSVSATAGNAVAPDGSIPITYSFEERPLHVVGITGTYSTDLGASLKGTWSHRNLFGNAEQLNLSAAAGGLGGSAVNGLGYDASAQFLKPDFLQRDQTLELNAEALKQDLDAYNQRAVILGGALRRKLSPLWTVSVGLSGEHEVVIQEGVSRTYTLIGLPFTAKYDSTGLANPLIDPIEGSRATFTATPTQSLGQKSSMFAILQASGSTYIDLGRFWSGTPGHSVLALRGLIGSVQGAGQFDLPPDQRFYGGGSATVRGYKYQSIGPMFPDNKPIGGTAIDAGTIELRQRLFGNFGVVAFADAGQVSAGSAPFSGTLRVGIGAGLRYYTPIGPVRLDIAIPTSHPANSDRFEVYLGLGQAF